MTNSRSGRAQRSVNVPTKTKKEVMQRKQLENGGERNPRNRKALNKEKRMALQQDVDKLRKKLRHEENIHRALKRAFTRSIGTLPRLPPFLPPPILELLAEVAVLEEEVVRLEEQVVHCRQDLYLEAVHISKKSTESPVDFHNLYQSERPKPDQSKSVPIDKAIGSFAPIFRRLQSVSDDRRGKENKLGSMFNKIAKKTPVRKSQTVRTLVKKSPPDHKQMNRSLDAQRLQVCSLESVPLKQIMKNQEQENRQENRMRDQDYGESGVNNHHEDKFSRDDCPNKISEDLVKCLSKIFLRMSSVKNRGSAEQFSYLSSSLVVEECSNETESRDPYGTCPDFGRRDIGPYKHFADVQARSINTNTTSSSLFLLHRLKLLLGRLSSVELQNLNHQEKLAFWINIYNSCMLNAFLEHGIPECPEMVVTLMGKATINVGGQLLKAITIEHFILRLPYHSKYNFPKNGARYDEKTARSKFGLELSEPLVTFALSCGSWSSPAVRVYTADHVESELEAAKKEFLQAAIGVSSTRFSIPKLLVWYLTDFAKDLDSLLDWVCLQLPNELGKEAMKCLDSGKSRSSPSQFVDILPYDFSFRYLFCI